ncbi:MAG: hypothetical protein WC379_13680 [Methanoregula sp.]|jgi:hypothetical protein
MNSYLHSNGKQVKFEWVVFKISIVIIGVLLAAGCIGHSEINLTPNNSTINYSGTLIISTQTQSGIVSSDIMSCPEKKIMPYSIISGEPFIFSDTTIRPSGNTVRLWVFGERFATWYNMPIKSSVLNNISLDGDRTSQLKNGTYYLLFQYPENGDQFNIDMKNSNYPNWIINKNGNLVLDLQQVKTGNLNSLEARTILEQAINTPGSGDQSDNVTLNVEGAWIIVNPVNNITSGTKFTINGSTNLPISKLLVIQIGSTTSKPLQMDHPSENYGTIFSTFIYPKQSEDCVNRFSVEIPLITIKPGKYYVIIEDHEEGYVDNRTVFNII